MTALGGRDSDWVSSIFCHSNTSLTMILNPPSDLNIFEILNNTFSWYRHWYPRRVSYILWKISLTMLRLNWPSISNWNERCFPLIRLWVITLSVARLVKFNNISWSSFLLHFNSSAPRKFTSGKHQPSWSLWLKT